MAVFNNYNPYQNSNVYSQQPMNTVQALMQLVYVHGRAGAEAFQLPPGVVRQILWDDETDRFYVKALDDMGNDGRGSGYYPMYPMNSYDNYRGGMSGRRYYDDEMGNAVHKIEHMMETEMNPEKRKAMQDILGVIQMR